MTHRTGPTQSQLLGVMRHLADVAALRDRPAEQGEALADGLGRLFGANLGWVYAIDDMRPGRTPRPVYGAPAAERDPAWARYMAAFASRARLTDDLSADHLIASTARQQQWVRDRALADPVVHRRHAPAIEMLRAAGIGDGAVCGFRTGPGGDRMVGFSLHRHAGDGRMTAGDYALHRFALAEVRRLVDRGHLRLDTGPATPDASSLPPQLVRVLDGLKRGLAPKEIARELRLSVWTVREHVGRLYAKLDVHSREELMARFIASPQP